VNRLLALVSLVIVFSFFGERVFPQLKSHTTGKTTSSPKPDSSEPIIKNGPFSPPLSLPGGFLNSDSKLLPAELRKEIAKFKGAVGSFSRRRGKGSVAYGSAYIVQPGNLLVTACHNLGIPGSYEGREDQHTFKFKPEGSPKWITLEKPNSINIQRDTCTFILPRKMSPSLPRLTKVQWEAGSRIILMGYPGATKVQKVSIGHVIRPFREQLDGIMGEYLTTAATQKGLSGGVALLLNSEGKILGAIGTLHGGGLDSFPFKGVKVGPEHDSIHPQNLWSVLSTINSSLLNAPKYRGFRQIGKKPKSRNGDF